MKKEARKSLLIARAAALGLVSSVVGLVHVSRSEIREETQNAKRTQVSDSITDEELDGVESQLAFDKITETKETESHSLLSTKEKEQLARDVLARRLRFAIVLRPTNEAELNDYQQLANAAHV